jgi:hypothetical protein
MPQYPPNKMAVTAPQGAGIIPSPGAPLIQVPPNPQQLVPPATPRTSGRPGYTLGDIQYQAVEPTLTPQEQAVSIAPGRTFSLTPGGPLQVATPTARMESVVAPSGSSVVRNGKITTVPQTDVNKTTLKPSGSATGQTGKPTQFDKQVEAWAQEFSNLLPTEDTTWLGGYAGTPSQSPQQQAQEKIKKMALTDPTSARIMQQAYFQVFGGGLKPQSGVGGTKDPLEGRTASGPNGPMIRRNGQWVPYNGQ